jgi:hypothetical protein
VRLDDAIVRRFLGLVDGTRDLDALVRDLAASLRSDPPRSAAQVPEITREAVKHQLQLLAKLGLLEPSDRA